ncbi:UNVERIFIED_CONTAM: hypothetical protein FKN15_051341 [Acipenser sinensis]
MLGWRCERQAEKVLREVKSCLSPGLREAVEDEATQRGERQDSEFLELLISPLEREEQEQEEEEERGKILKVGRLFKVMVGSRLKVDFTCFKLVHYMEAFQMK